MATIITTTQYSQLNTEEGYENNKEYRSRGGEHGDWNLFPGERRKIMGRDSSNNTPQQSTPTTTTGSQLLVLTGGNALQAIDRQVACQEDMISVVVPSWAGVKPGDTMLVLCPEEKGGKLISVTIPPESYPGYVFLVRVPSPPPPSTTTTTLQKEQQYQKQKKQEQPVVVIGVPVEEGLVVESTSNTRAMATTTPSTQHVSNGQPTVESDLLLQVEEPSVVATATAEENDEFEMVRNPNTMENDGFEMVRNPNTMV